MNQIQHCLIAVLQTFEQRPFDSLHQRIVMGVIVLRVHQFLMPLEAEGFQNLSTVLGGNPPSNGMKKFSVELKDLWIMDRLTIHQFNQMRLCSIHLMGHPIEKLAVQTKEKTNHLWKHVSSARNHAKASNVWLNMPSTLHC